MIIEINKKEWDVNDCTYAQRRELHKLNAKVWWDGKMDVEAYYEVLEKVGDIAGVGENNFKDCLLYTSPSPRDRQKSRMPSSA